MSTITQAELQSKLFYDPETGLFNNIKKRRLNNSGGIGSLYSCGYVYIYVNSRRFLAHRLAWLYVYGTFPENDLDHINGIRHDNRICNLRACTRSENLQNYKKPCTNKSGYIGVHWHKRDQIWRAAINHNGKLIRLGTFNTAEEASEAYLKAKKNLHTMNPIPNR